MAQLPEPAYSCEDFQRVLWDMAYDPVAPDPTKPSLAQAEIEFARRGHQEPERTDLEIMQAEVRSGPRQRQRAVDALKSFWTILSHLEALTDGLVTVSGGWPEDYVPRTKAEQNKIDRAVEHMRFLQSIPKELYDSVYPEALAEWEAEDAAETAKFAEYAKPFDPVSYDTFSGAIATDFKIGSAIPLKVAACEDRAEELAHLDLAPGQPLRLGLLAVAASADYAVDPAKNWTPSEWNSLKWVAGRYAEMFLKEFKNNEPETFAYVDTFMNALKEIEDKRKKAAKEAEAPITAIPGQASAPKTEAEQERQEWEDQVSGYRYVPGQEYARNEIKGYIDAQHFLDRLNQMREMASLTEQKLVGNNPQDFPWEAKLSRARSASAEAMNEQQQVASLLGQYREQQRWMVSYIGRLYRPSSLRLDDPNTEAFFQNVFKIACALAPLSQELADAWLLAEAEAAGKAAAFQARQAAEREKAAAEEERFEYESKLAAREALALKEQTKFIPVLTKENYQGFFGVLGKAETQAENDLKDEKVNLTLVAIAHAPGLLFVPAFGDIKKSNIAKAYARKYLAVLKTVKSPPKELIGSVKEFTDGIDAYLADGFDDANTNRFYKLAGVFARRFDAENKV